MPIIDMHTHTVSKRVEPVVTGQYDPMDNPIVATCLRRAGPPTRARQAVAETDARRRCAPRGDAADGSIFRSLPPAPAQQHYWAGEELQVALSRIKNEDVTDDQAREKIGAQRTRELRERLERHGCGLD